MSPGILKKTGGINSAILKVMSVFSSLQVVNMLCSVVKTKFVALWLGASGVGLFGIYQTVIDTLATLTDAGLRQSCVREVSQRRDSPEALSRIAAVVRSWNVVAGIAGAVALTILCPWLSEWIFGNRSHWWAFLLLGATMLLNSLTSGENAILQGTGGFRFIARASLFTSLGGLAISIPLFRWLGEASVPLSFIAYSLCAFLVIHRLRFRGNPHVRPSLSLLRAGTGFARLGLFMSLAAFATSLSQTIFISWLNRYADTDTVGLFQAGHILVVRYVGFIISAVALEFYPRLSANISSPMRHRLFVSHEILLLLLVLTPLLLVFLLLRPVIVDLLYTDAFRPVLPFVTVGIIHTVFRASSTCIAYSIVAKGDGKTYLLTETFDSFFGMALCMLFYAAFGLTGIAWAYVVWFLSYLILVSAVSRIRYGLRITRPATLAIILSAVSTSLGALAVSFLHPALYIPILCTGIILGLMLLRRFLIRR